jgi:hypothetical protein
MLAETPEYMEPPEILDELPFEIMSIDKLDPPRTYQVAWRTVADDGLPEETSDVVVVPKSSQIELYLESWISERKQTRIKANKRAREEREEQGPELKKSQSQKAMLNRLKKKSDQKGKRPS